MTECGNWWMSSVWVDEWVNVQRRDHSVQNLQRDILYVGLSQDTYFLLYLLAFFIQPSAILIQECSVSYVKQYVNCGLHGYNGYMYIATYIVFYL